MENVGALPLIDWLDRIARPSAVWASGSVSAVTCSQAWALVEMIAGLAGRRTDDAGLIPITSRARLARQQLLFLAAEDALAFQYVLRDPSPHHYAKATHIPLQVLAWSLEGEDATRYPALRDYSLAALDLNLACTLFEVVSATSRALIEANLSHLTARESDMVRQRLDTLGGKHSP